MENKENMNELLKQLRVRDPKISVTFNPEQSAIATLRGKLSPPVKIEELKKSPHKHARLFIRENKALLGDVDESKELDDKRAIMNRRGMTHVAFYQKHGDARVLGSTLSVHYGADGSAYLIKSNLDSTIELPKKPKIGSDQAAKIAMEHAGSGAVFFEKMEPKLMVANAKILHLEKEGQKHYLCWQLAVIWPKGSRDPDWIYFVDALDGKVLFRYPADRTGTGTGNYSHGAALNSEASGTTFWLRDTVTSSAWPEATKPIIHTYDDAGSTRRDLTNYSEDADDDWDNVGPPRPPHRVDDQGPEADIHRFLGYVLSYFYLTHDYNGWDGEGKDAKAHSHNERWPNNAYWSGTYEQIYFADGNGDPGDLMVTRDFMCPLDTVTHEYGHGVKYYYDILQTYTGETGALDEATNDLFGAFVALDHPLDDPWPWHHGRQYRLDGTLGRNMIDPSRDTAGVVQYDATNNATKEASCLNGYYPDHYSIRYTGTEDYHGVHWNCPIITHAVYLMINGGTHRLSGVTVTGIGIGPVEQMLYEVISTDLLTNTSDFADFRIAFIQACQTLFPENLDYLATVKEAFYAVGIGPDLYIRDTLSDQGEEPGTLSCMSPDIIVRQQPADAATLTLIGDINNTSLSQQIKLGPDDHYVYFRLFNRGFVPASGTFRLFISPGSTFPTPSSWHEVGYYDFPDVPDGGIWLPMASGECITLPASLINTLGVGHYCFIGIIESDADKQPDWMLIDNLSEFHDFIRKSNNYAWHNCNIEEDVHPDAFGDIPAMTYTFQINRFDRLDKPRDLEIDTRDLPEGTQVAVWIPRSKLWGLKAFDVRALLYKTRVLKIGGALEDLPDDQTHVRPVSLSRIAKFGDIDEMIPAGMKRRDLRQWGSLYIAPGKVVRFTDLSLGRDRKMDIRFVVKFPKNTGTRDVTLAFREKDEGRVLGQMNYVFRIRKALR